MNAVTIDAKRFWLSMMEAETTQRHHQLYGPAQPALHAAHLDVIELRRLQDWVPYLLQIAGSDAVIRGHLVAMAAGAPVPMAGRHTDIGYADIRRALLNGRYYASTSGALGSTAATEQIDQVLSGLGLDREVSHA